MHRIFRHIFHLVITGIFLIVPWTNTLGFPGDAPVPEIERISADLYYLASDELEGREAGSPGALLAAEYIARNFEATGLEPVDDDYYLDFEFTVDISPGEMNMFEIIKPGGTESVVMGEGFTPLTMSRNGLATGEVVFAGYGISAPELGWDDYAEIDASGKVVFCLIGEPNAGDAESRIQSIYPRQYSSVRLKAHTAYTHGATALIVVTGPATIEEGGEDRLPSINRRGTLGEAEIPVVYVSQETAEKLWAPMGAPLKMIQTEMDRNMMPYGTDIDGVSVLISVDLERTNVRTVNVAGVLPGCDPELADEYVIVGAHYDHLGIKEEETESGETEWVIYNGADDNASGVAGVLELARLFTVAEEQPSRSILFICFDAEEKGLLGSYSYIGTPAVPLENTVAMVNMDMIGRASPGEDGMPLSTIQGIHSCTVFEEIVPATTPDGEVRLLAMRNPVGGGDYVPFYNCRIPILNFFTGEHEDYNTPNDDADRINYEGMASILGAVHQVIYDVADYPGELEFNVSGSQETVLPGDPDSAPQFSVYLGTIPDFMRTDEGFYLSGVNAGSPAEEAGLMAEDKVLSIDDHVVLDIISYTSALGFYEPGDTAEITVLRDGEEIVLTVTFGSREEERDVN